MARPDFIIIGAMKCGTSTLRDQLAGQPSVFMSTPKEPNFFSDDDIHARGMGWYETLFDAAAPGDLKGEASTHYTKLPTYPDCVDRLAAALPDIRLVYVVRDPFERLISHYIHEWTMGVMRDGLEASLERHPELVDYGRYAMQIRPYVERFGTGRIFVTSLEALRADPSGEFLRLGAFLGAADPLIWREDVAPSNVSAQRERRFPFYDAIVGNPVLAAIRRTLVPKGLRNAVKARLRMRERPTLTDETRARLAGIFADDRADLMAMFPELRWPGT